MIISLLFIKLESKVELGLSITTVIISFGISFAFYLVSSLFFAIIFQFFGMAYSNANRRGIVICAILLQLILSYLPFKFRRLKSGMPFLRNKGGGNAGVIISTVLLCCFIVISNVNNSESFLFIMPIISIFLCGVFIFIWWRGRLKEAYIEKLRTEEIQSLRDDLRQKDEQIENLKKNNDFLAKVIHKDNKLVPALELAVTEYIQTSQQKCENDLRTVGQILLEQLKAISSERMGIISGYQAENKKLPSTEVFQIDAMMSYMFNKATVNGIHYELIISGSTKFMIENVISLSDLRTLLADLIENAIIATKASENKEILVSIGIAEEHYSVEIFDSGIPFQPEVIKNFGFKNTTTHADTGGSGIGLITAYEILKKYKASFIIEEFSNDYGAFTKRVAVNFDNLNQFIVKMKNNEDVKLIT